MAIAVFDLTQYFLDKALKFQQQLVFLHPIEEDGLSILTIPSHFLLLLFFYFLKVVLISSLLVVNKRKRVLSISPALLY